MRRRWVLTVYPRVCGGTGKPAGTPAAAGGLSPRVRGNRQAARSGVLGGGSIPACAGEPALAAAAAYDARVYPRVCGGTAGDTLATSACPGLSPRVRGNRIPVISRNSWLRSIPACAGEPPYRRVSAAWSGVYPRVCGGTIFISDQPAIGLGLSPRVRGNRFLHFRGGLNRRSIPACAGEPSGGILTCRRKAVYPRVCGGTSSRKRLPQ